MMTSIFNELRALIESANPLALMAWATGYFTLLYLYFASAALLLARALRRPLASAPIAPAQYVRELVNSARSIAIFGSGIAIPWGLVHLGITGIRYDASGARIAAELFLLIIWNDLHFYAMHRLLHTRLLKPAHAAHHQSIVASPYAAYSFSALETALLGSVMPLAMLGHNFSVEALLLLPVWSITINTLAHSNCDLFYWAKTDSLLHFIRRHQIHHSRYHGNFGFFFPQLDRWFSTASSASPAKCNSTSGGQP